MDLSTENLVQNEKDRAIPAEHLDAYWRSAFGQLRLKRRQQIFKDHFEEGSLILELGAGTGQFEHNFKLSSSFLVASDLNVPLLKHGLDNNFLKAGNAVCLDAHHLPFSDNSFDGVFGNAVLHHLNVQRSLSELQRVLKPGGHLIFSEPNMLNPIVWAVKNIDWLGKKFHETPDETAFTKKELQNYAIQAGFDDVHVQHYDFCLGPKFLLKTIKALEVYLEKSFLKAISISLLLKARAPKN